MDERRAGPRIRVDHKVAGFGRHQNDALGESERCLRRVTEFAVDVVAPRVAPSTSDGVWLPVSV